MLVILVFMNFYCEQVSGLRARCQERRGTYLNPAAHSFTAYLFKRQGGQYTSDV
jgi:hypothetical protein